jgi:HK97 family phage major capsid protein
MSDIAAMLADIRAKPQARFATIQRTERSEGDASPAYEMSFSSEAEIERWGSYIEVLSHEPGAVDLSRAMNGLALLEDHRSEKQVGRAVNMALRADRKLVGEVKWSRSQRGQEIRQDVDDDIRRDVSIGYEILDAQQTGVRNGIPIITITRWRPYEVSLVAVPADITVGKDRGAPLGGYNRDTQATTQDPIPTTTSTRGSDDMKKAADGADATAEDGEGERKAPGRVDVRQNEDLTAMARLTRTHGMTDMLPGFLERGLTLEAARDEMLAAIAKRTADANPAKVPSAGVGQLGLSSGEGKRYNLYAAIEAALTGNASRAGYEMELSDAVAGSLGGRSTRGFYVPGDILLLGARETARRNVMATRALGGNFGGATGATDGPEFNIAEAGTYIDFLYNAARVVEAGAQVVPGLDREQVMPRMTGPLVGSFVPELPGSDIGTADPTFDQEKLTPRACSSPVVQISRQSLTASAPFSLQAIVINAIARAIGLGIDRGAISGTGTGGQPVGIFARPGVDAGAMSAFDWANLVDLKTLVAVNNADLSGAGYMMTPELAGLAEVTRKDAGSGVMLLENGRINGFPCWATNQMPKNLAGTGTNAHGAVFGNFGYMILALFGGGVEIIIDPLSQKRRNMVEIMGVQLADIGFTQPGGFRARRWDLTP